MLSKNEFHSIYKHSIPILADFYALVGNFEV